MPPPVRRRGAGLLQNPRPGLLPSPRYAGFGPLGPLRAVLSTRQSSLSLRPAAALLLASSPGSHPTPENLLPPSSGGLRGRASHPPVVWPLSGHDVTRTSRLWLGGRSASALASTSWISSRRVCRAERRTYSRGVVATYTSSLQPTCPVGAVDSNGPSPQRSH